MGKYLDRLESAGLTVTLLPDRAKFRVGPVEKITPTLRDLIRASRDAILLDDGEPELMYKMATNCAIGFDDLLSIISSTQATLNPRAGRRRRGYR
jgi:hypothetical protein